MKIGFIGTGNMGKPMAINLIKAGHELTVNDLRKETTQELVEMGAKWGDSARDVALASEVVITSLPAPADVEHVCMGDDGILAGAKEGDLYIDMTTNFPSTIKKLAESARKKGVEVLDAPVSGGVRGARKGTLSIMVGGTEASFERAKPILDVLGSNIFYMGEVGSGNATKLVNNLISLTNIVTSMEGMVLGVKAGLDPKRLFEVVKSSTGNSFVFEGIYPRLVFKGRFEPPAFAIDLAAKDLQLAVDLARQSSIPVQVADRALKTYNEAKSKGLGAKDVAAAITMLEEVAGVELRVQEE